MVFENAAIQTMIMLFKNNKRNDDYKFEYSKLNGDKLQLESVLNLLDNIKTENTIYLEPLVKRENLLNKPLTFNSDINDELLNKIKAKHNFYLREKADKKKNLKSEIANGIHHHHDIVNKDRKEILNNKFAVGTGIFVLNSEELNTLKLTEKEIEIIKPQFSSKQVSKYYTNSQNEDWVIYTRSDINKEDKLTKEIPINNYPNIKNHLNKFKSVITSDFAPYGLHRAREQYFFEGEKIAVLRKCSKEPIFSYSNFDCYLPAAFYIIQSDRINLKYLTGLLNSKLVAFWLRKRGKMQGNTYQLDKEPLLEIPIYEANITEQENIETLVDQIITAKQQNQDTKALEVQIDQMVYKLYELKDEEIKIVEGE
jgi:adenine-specific DNA-methyltransferase